MLPLPGGCAPSGDPLTAGRPAHDPHDVEGRIPLLVLVPAVRRPATHAVGGTRPPTSAQPPRAVAPV